SAAAQDFGANDWLIEEMYERYEADPSSVDSTWADFFRSQKGTVPITASEPTKPSESPEPTASSATSQMTQPAPAPRLEQEPPARAPAAAQTPTPTAVSEQRPPEPAKPSTGTSEPSEPAPAAPVQPTTSATPSPKAPVTATPDLSAVNQAYLPAQPPSFSKRPAPITDHPTKATLRGAPLRTAKNMDSSLEMPTATSVRAVPMKLVIDHRTMINAHLARTIGGKVSFTHLIGYAMVQALKMVPAMNVAYEVVDGKPTLVEPDTINLGIAIDMTKPDGTRQLVVPNIRSCEQLTFGQFWSAYEEVVSKARKGTLTVDDFAGTTATLTNPGGIGTNHSIPRLMQGQGLILGVGSIEYAPGYLGASPERLNEIGVSKVMTLTSTYDHRVIQGAQSGEFLRSMEQLLLGKHGFYEGIFTSLRIPYAPLEWDTDIYVGSAPELVDKEARVLELIASYRALGHLMADIDPLTYRMRRHADLELKSHGLTLWDLDRTFPCGSLGGKPRTAMTLRDALEILRDAYCRHVGVEYMHIVDPEQRTWLQGVLERPPVALNRDEHLRILDKLNESEIFETFLQTKFIGQKRFSLEGGESTIVAVDEICEQAADTGLSEVIIGMPHRGRLNVLANIVGKSYGQIFREFEGNMDPHNTQGTGDVKYHLGAEGEFVSANGSRIRASVAANPSHLEAVDPVVEGIARAKQDRLSSDHEFPVLPILLHGDAAFSGQGVVY
ncbi:MAG TPA: multifunctional oxoglutarate decarboxylase/oxoglutarate dehydrogenase thiamine pyrophosphate-binding subunit/dihydrolipoyllysine-residue succinyltransferase subunit, partial [Propionibacteriaceae bacterium]